MDEVWLERLLRLVAAIADEEELERFLKGLPAPVRRVVEEAWSWQAHGGQKEPGGDWRVWLIQAGRGFGKTRAGAEWVSARARKVPDARIALVGANLDDVVKVMVDGESGLKAVARADEEVRWIASARTARFSSGAEAYAYSGERPDKLRGPQHHYAWCDELGKWAHPDAAWDNLMLGLRLGERPRTIVTTTPRAIPLLKRIGRLERCARTFGGTRENVHLPEDFVASVRAMYEGTRLGRQELGGEMIEEAEGTLWPRELIEAARVGPGRPAETGGLVRVVVAVDPPGSADGDACGIVAAGLGRDGIGYVLGDHSVAGLRPEGWARAVALAAAAHGADRVVAEKNMGGDMVESVLRAAEAGLPVRLVAASRGKIARAEPVAALFERGKARLAGAFPELEDQLAGMVVAGRYEGPGRSPDRADAMVWALSELMLGKSAPEPRIRAM